MLIIMLIIMIIELLMLTSNTWNHLTVCKQMSSGSFKNNITSKQFTYKSYIYYILSKVGDLSWGWPKGSLFNSYYTEV